MYDRSNQIETSHGNLNKSNCFFNRSKQFKVSQMKWKQVNFCFKLFKINLEKIKTSQRLSKKDRVQFKTYSNNPKSRQ